LEKNPHRTLKKGVQSFGEGESHQGGSLGGGEHRGESKKTKTCQGKPKEERGDLKRSKGEEIYQVKETGKVKMWEEPISKNAENAWKNRRTGVIVQGKVGRKKPWGKKKKQVKNKTKLDAKNKLGDGET